MAFGAPDTRGDACLVTLARQALAEAVGTFALIFIGAGSIVGFAAIRDPSSLLGVAFAHGLTIAVMVTATGHISGGHLNPAVTLGLYSAGRVRASQALIYILAQLSGAILGALTLSVIVYGSGPAATEAAGLTHLGTPGLPTPAPGTTESSLDVTVGTGILTEAILTFFLVFVISGTAVDERTPAKMGGLAIGLTVTLDILMGGPLTGAAMNPARHLGPALVANFWGTKALEPFVYWVGPILGGILGALVYNYGLYQPMHTERDLRPGQED